MKRVNGCGNTRQQYGWLAVGLHGLSALLLVSLFALGFWMVELSYYDYWYKLAPFYHKSVGILFFFLVLLRWLVRAWGETVDPAVSLSRWERVASTWGHRILYVGMVLVPVLGYGISTADGRGVAVFSLFTIPALPFTWENQEDVMGLLHKWGAYGLVTLAAGHAGMAVYHGRTVWQRMFPFFR